MDYDTKSEYDNELNKLRHQYELEMYELNKYDSRNTQPLPLQIHHFRNRWIKRIRNLKSRYELLQLLRTEQREMQEASQ